MFPLPTPQSSNYDFDQQYPLPCAKVLGERRKRKYAFRPASVVNVSGMSFGSISASAVEALNRGAKISQWLHNTGEGGVSPHRYMNYSAINPIGGCPERPTQTQSYGWYWVMGTKITDYAVGEGRRILRLLKHFYIVDVVISIFSLTSVQQYQRVIS